jgi:hypothetical protein
MGYINIEKKKLVCAATLLVVLVTAISSIATKMIVLDGVSSRIQRESIDMNFDNDRCEKVALDKIK